MKKFFSLLFCLFYQIVSPIKCNVGYGQRGKLRSDGYEWTRDCKFSFYCWEAITTDVKRMELMFDFPWNSYYRQFYVKGCSGDFDISVSDNPFLRKPKPSIVMVNLTTPVDINGIGGKAEFQLMYACGHNFCSASSQINTPTIYMTIIISIMSTLLLLQYF